MNRRVKPLATSTLGAVCAFAMHAGAQSSGGAYRIERSVIAGGGSTIGGGAFEMRGTVGQNAISSSSSSNYRFDAGFWPPAAGATTDRIFANGFDP
jgi:hypothetical protein